MDAGPRKRPGICSVTRAEYAGADRGPARRTSSYLCSTLVPAVHGATVLRQEWPEVVVSARQMAEPQGLASLADPTFDSKAVVVNFGSTAGLARVFEFSLRRLPNRISAEWVTTAAETQPP